MNTIVKASRSARTFVRERGLLARLSYLQKRFVTKGRFQDASDIRASYETWMRTEEQERVRAFFGEDVPFVDPVPVVPGADFGVKTSDGTFVFVSDGSYPSFATVRPSRSPLAPHPIDGRTSCDGRSFGVSTANEATRSPLPMQTNRPFWLRLGPDGMVATNFTTVISVSPMPSAFGHRVSMWSRFASPPCMRMPPSRVHNGLHSA